MGTWRGVVGLFAVLVAFSTITLAQSDTEPPVLVDFDFNPKSVDVTAGSASVTCEMTFVDSPAGVDWVRCRFWHQPSNQYAHCDAFSPTSGDIYNGTWVCEVTIPQFSAEGTWEILSTLADDNAGNRGVEHTADIIQMGFPTQLSVTSSPDTDSPVLVGFDFNPKSVDVTAGSASVTCEMTFVDSPAGVDWVRCRFWHQPSNQYAHCDAFSPTSGDIYNGTWVCEVTIPQFSAEGTWEVLSTLADDNAGNRGVEHTADIIQMGFPTQLSVTSSPDTDSPVLVGFDFNPKSVDVTAGSASVTCEMTFVDSPAGVDWVRCRFWHQPSNQYAHCDAFSPTSGDIYNGTWVCEVTIPQFSAEGTWEVLSTLADDNAGNRGVEHTADLIQMGFPVELDVGFVDGQPKARVVTPRHGHIVHGNSVTVRAGLVQGHPADISTTLGVRFDHRALPFDDFTPIPARNQNHPNPDTSYPYFIHWDVSEVPEGDYELRAVAHDLAGTPDPSPETIIITIDHAGPADVDEYINADGRQENQTQFDSGAENRIASGDHTEASTATELALPPGSLLYTNDTAKLVYPDPADEEGQLEQVEQSIGAFVDLSLLSGQIDLEAGMSGDLNISYADADQDGVVDGTSIREEDLELRHLDTGTNSYVVVPSIVLIEHNMVHAEPGFLGKFALAGPLTPKMWVEGDKATLGWEAVSTATSYVVYRGLLSTLIDTDADGLPDTGYGDCMNHLDIDPTDLVFTDFENPITGSGFLYLVGFVGPSGATGLGNTSAGWRRTPAVPCP